jgi:hypothetical protein
MPETTPTLEQATNDLAKAEAELGRLRQAAERAAEASTAAQRAFKTDPTAKAHADMAVAEQLAQNATEAASAYETTTLAALREARQQASDAIEREALRAELDPVLIEEQVEQLTDAIENAAQAIDSTAKKLAGLLLLHREKAGRASSLGIRVRGGRVGELIQQIHERLQRNLTVEGVEAHKSHVRLTIVDTGTTVPVVRLELSRPTRINGYIL